MSDPGTLVLLVVLTVIAALLLNLLLIASVRTNARRTDAKTLGQMLKAVRNPFQSADADLDELASLVDKVRPKDPPSSQDTDQNAPPSA